VRDTHRFRPTGTIGDFRLGDRTNDRSAVLTGSSDRPTGWFLHFEIYA